MSLITQITGALGRVFSVPEPGDGEAGRIIGADVSAALIGLGAKMAKADGQVRREDIDAFNEVFQFGDDQAPMIGRLFDLARQTTLGFDRYAEIVARKFRARPAALEDVLDGLFHIALADGILSDEEGAFLEVVAEIFGFSDREYLRVRAVHLGEHEGNPYLMLGVDPNISDADLRRAYHRIAAANHPDRLIARGLPAEMLRLANHKMAMINRAYAQVRAERMHEVACNARADTRT